MYGYWIERAVSKIIEGYNELNRKNTAYRKIAKYNTLKQAKIEKMINVKVKHFSRSIIA